VVSPDRRVDDVTVGQIAGDPPAGLVRSMLMASVRLLSSDGGDKSHLLQFRASGRGGRADCEAAFKLLRDGFFCLVGAEHCEPLIRFDDVPCPTRQRRDFHVVVDACGLHERAVKIARHKAALLVLLLSLR
jgi:hypothetical protein